MRAFRFTESAEADVDGILSHTIATWGDAQAEAYIGGLFHVLELVAAKPAMGRLRPDLAPELRGFSYREHTIFYLLSDGEVLVVRILASRMNIRANIFTR